MDKATLGKLDLLFWVQEVLDLGIEALDLLVVGLNKVLLPLLNIIKLEAELVHFGFSIVGWVCHIKVRIRNRVVWFGSGRSRPLHLRDVP